MTSILNEGQLKRLSEHKYSAHCATILDPFFQIYWRWLVEQLPLWLAPNTITFLGLAINVLTSMTLIYYCPKARGEVSTGRSESIIFGFCILSKAFLNSTNGRDNSLVHVFHYAFGCLPFIKCFFALCHYSSIIMIIGGKDFLMYVFKCFYESRLLWNDRRTNFRFSAVCL